MICILCYIYIYYINIYIYYYDYIIYIYIYVNMFIYIYICMYVYIYTYFILSDEEKTHLAGGEKTSPPCKLQKSKESKQYNQYIHSYIHSYIHIHTLFLRHSLSIRSTRFTLKPSLQRVPWKAEAIPREEAQKLWLSTFQRRRSN